MKSKSLHTVRVRESVEVFPEASVLKFFYNPMVLNPPSSLHLLLLIGGRRDGAVRIQNHLNTANHCNQQKQTQQDQEEESEAQIHINIQLRHRKRQVHDY